MLRLVHKIATWILKRRLEQVQRFMEHPLEVQEQMFYQLIGQAKDTAWGRTYGYADAINPETYRQRVPVRNYEALYPWIERAFNGESDVLWPGRVSWFSKSSGTTNDKSKFIPVSEASMEDCHYKAGQDMLAIYLDQRPDSKLFTGKALSIGGSHTPSPTRPDVHLGDVSAVLTENLPIFYELIRTPRKEVALLPDWEAKLEAMLREVGNEDVTSIAGVPTWTLVLIRRLMEQAGTRNLLDIWPNLELYCHGGVSFEPYREQFRGIIPGSQMNYMDCYNASEGFFGLQDRLDHPDLLLLLDYGIYYEFIPVEEWDKEFPRTHTLAEVELGRNYAVVISTNAGLWRYKIGDTVAFTSRYPYRFRITGRTKQYINAFGEELMVDNAEQAIAEAARATGALVRNYTVAPIYFSGDAGKGGHEWLIEYETLPDDQARFEVVLDQHLKTLNSDYEAKRQGGLALEAPRVRVMPAGTFHQWMKRRGKLGGQHKVPRLSNTRDYVEDILQMLSAEAI
ncbi:MAG: GH3 auxin-responsive promoter family protein [Bacteroidia bacterium]